MPLFEKCMTLSTEVQIKDLPNASMDHYHCTNLLSFQSVVNTSSLHECRFYCGNVVAKWLNLGPSRSRWYTNYFWQVYRVLVIVMGKTCQVVMQCWQQRHSRTPMRVLTECIKSRSLFQEISCSFGNLPTARIWGSPSGGYEEYHLLGYNAM
jgi:hypothetical protein